MPKLPTIVNIDGLIEIVKGEPASQRDKCEQGHATLKRDRPAGEGCVHKVLPKPFVVIEVVKVARRKRKEVFVSALAVENEVLLAKAIVVQHLLAQLLGRLARCFVQDTLRFLHASPPEMVGNPVTLAQKRVRLPVVWASLVDVGVPVGVGGI